MHGVVKEEWSVRGWSELRVCLLCVGMQRPGDAGQGHLSCPFCTAQQLCVGTAKHWDAAKCRHKPWGNAHPCFVLLALM